MKLKSLLFSKLITILALFLVIWGFFYFETSTILRILVVLLGLVGIWQISNLPEILILVIFYLGLYDLYNIRYGLAIPMAVILVGVLGLTSLLFYYQSRLSKFEFPQNRFWVLLLVTCLIVLEIFLTMSLWPVDPKTKSLVIAVVFYLATRIVYLHINNVLSLKKAAGYLLAGVLTLGLVLAISWWFGF